MSVVAHCRRRGNLLACCASYLLVQSTGRRCCGTSRVSAFSSACSSLCRGGWQDGWRSCSARGGCSRSCGCWSAPALLVGLAPMYAHGLDVRELAANGIRSRIRAGLGCRHRLRLAAAYQAKFHRLAALILLGGAGLVTCISFVWLSAPDLALTQLVVETVTTVLLLLGLRWLPKRIEQIGSATPRRT